MDTKSLTLDEEAIMVVVTAATDFTQFHLQLSSEDPMSVEDIVDCIRNFADTLEHQGDVFFESADHVGEIN